MNKFLRLCLVLLSILTGFVFLYSAYTKLGPLGFEGYVAPVFPGLIRFFAQPGAIQSFEFTIVEFVKLPWLLAALLSRFLIGVELAIGALLVLHLFGRGRWVIKLALAILAVFSIYLAFLWATAGNKINCGCFGDNLFMSPSSSLLKNAVLAVMLLVLLRFHNGFSRRRINTVTLLLALALTSLPYIIYPLPPQKPDWLQKGKFKIRLSALYDAKASETPPATDLTKGKHIISFLSLSCPHCRMAARKMHIMKEKNPELPFYFVLAGKKEYVKSFWEETKAIDVPHTKLDADSFTAIAGYSWPVIYWVEDGTVVAESNYITLSQAEIEKWMGPELKN
jgi:hypothetical protein